MFHALKFAPVLLAALAIAAPAAAQEVSPEADAPAAAANAEETAPPVEESEDATAPGVDEATELRRPAGEGPLRSVEGVVDQVDASPQAQEVTTSILAPVYSLAETFSFPAFHWLAFAVMVTGVVSFALQLALGKLVVLSKFSLSPTEILSDTLGLAVSLIGLVLTTQAATENSTFTASPSAVISATVAGGLFGLLFYVWGQRQELQAVEGRRRVAATKTTVADQQAS
jgi:hypothetical protein